MSESLPVRWETQTVGSDEERKPLIVGRGLVLLAEFRQRSKYSFGRKSYKGSLERTAELWASSRTLSRQPSNYAN